MVYIRVQVVSLVARYSIYIHLIVILCFYIPSSLLCHLVGNLKSRWRRLRRFTNGRHGHDHGHGYGAGLKIAWVSGRGLDGPVMGRTRVSVHPATEAANNSWHGREDVFASESRRRDDIYTQTHHKNNERKMKNKTRKWD